MMITIKVNTAKNAVNETMMNLDDDDDDAVQVSIIVQTRHGTVGTVRSTMEEKIMNLADDDDDDTVPVVVIERRHRMAYTVRKRTIVDGTMMNLDNAVTVVVAVVTAILDSTGGTIVGRRITRLDDEILVMMEILARNMTAV
jgi:transposase InsO family protein